METSTAEKIATYFRGIAERDPELAMKYLDPIKYRRHSRSSQANIQELEQWMTRLPPGRGTLTTVRRYQDGPFVFTHTLGDLPEPSIYFDVFEFDEELIVEHWVFREPAVTAANASGHTQIDGPTESRYIE